jgi:magnesium chelatase family protein
VKSLNLSARAYFRILKLSRTIADLGDENNIKKEHILEALSYRKVDDN